MKFFAISDLHLSTTTPKPMDIFGLGWTDYVNKIREDWLKKVSPCDVVLISGDLSWAMALDDGITDLTTFSDLPGKKVIIRGNHDYWWSTISKVRGKLPQDFYAIQNDSLKFDNVVICGSRGWTVEGSTDFTEEDKKLYNREYERLILALKDGQKKREEGDKLVVMIHFPPFNVKREDSLYTKLFEEYNVNLVVYGHLHGKDCKADKLVNKNGIEYYLTSCDLVGNKLVELPL